MAEPVVNTPETTQATPPPVVSAPSPQPAAAPPQQSSAPTPEVSVRDYLKQSAGLDLTGQFQDDTAALTYLAEQARQAQALQQQYQQVAPYAQEYMQNAAAFRQWQEQQLQQQRQQEAASSQWWKAPDYDPSWETKIYRDASGQLQLAPGAPPDTIQKYTNWVEHQKKFLNQFSKDPIGAIAPGIEQLVERKAQELIGRQMAQYQADQLANNYVQQNASWIYVHENGRPVFDSQGRPVFTPAGQRFAEHCQSLQAAGVHDVRAQQSLAQQMLERDLYEARLRQFAQQQPAQQQTPPPAADPAQAAKDAFLSRARGGAPPQNANPAPAPLREGPLQRSMQDALMAEFAANGYQPHHKV